MLPHDFIELVVKVIFVLSAAFVLCLSKVRAQDINYSPVEISFSTKIHK